MLFRICYLCHRLTLWDLSMFLSVTTDRSFSLLHSILLHDQIIVYLPIRLLIGICIVSHLGLWASSMCIWVNIRLHFYWMYIYRWNCWVIMYLCLLSVATTKQVSKGIVPTYIPTRSFWEFHLLYILTNSWY